MRLMFYLALPLCLVSCAVPAQRDASGARGARAAAGAAGALNLDALGRRIWQNECAGSTEGLVSWNSGEDFPSLGIGHFIWFPAGVQAPFDESFPRFVAYARQRGVQVPSFFLGDAPWANKQAFLADRSGRADAMRRWLAGHVRLQTEFIVLRSREALGRMMSCSSRPRDVQARYRALAATTQGMYCLVDYVNFKGEGTKASERYLGQGWGLLQVLEEMRGYPQGRAATAEFSRAAAAVLRRRVQNAPASRGESRWLQGWLNRCATYR